MASGIFWMKLEPKHAYPAEDEASPAAVGKLFSEQMYIFHFNFSSGILLLLLTKNKRKYRGLG